jgi:glycosyltransferase
MPPHPTFYTYKKIYIEYGFFDISYKISSDYDMMLRLLYEKKINAKYIPEVLVKMQRGGVSNQNFKSMMLKTKEDFLIMKKYNFSFITLINKTIRKFSQFIFRG